MSDIGRDGWPTADAVLRSERAELVALERENADLRERLAAADAMMRELIGWLSADIPELHRVEVPRLAASLNRFLAARAGEQWDVEERQA